MGTKPGNASQTNEELKNLIRLRRRLTCIVVPTSSQRL
jgi:hypothetical protein